MTGQQDDQWTLERLEELLKTIGEKNIRLAEAVARTTRNAQKLRDKLNESI